MKLAPQLDYHLAPALAAPGGQMSLLERWCRRQFLARLQGLEQGQLLVRDASGTELLGRVPNGLAQGSLPGEELLGEVQVVSPEFYPKILLGGAVGGATAYLDGLWNSPDLTKLFRLLQRNITLLDSFESGAARLSAALRQLWHGLRANTRRGSARNIREHYDLGNDFFQLFLDPTLSYSSALFTQPDMSLEQASLAKMDRLARLLQLSPDDHLLEIGTGWGGLALHLARHYRVRITTTTISPRQHELARRRIAEAGLSDRVTVLLQDYRDLRGQYDKIVSVEMIEAVGHPYLPLYFGQLGRLLKPGGLLAIQAITMPDHRYKSYLKNVDFIQRYVFPGSCVPSTSAMLSAMAESSDLRLVNLEDFGGHYAQTLRCWGENFERSLEQVRELGFDERFIRMWRYYLSYCEAGFAEGYTGLVQMLMRR